MTPTTTFTTSSSSGENFSMPPPPPASSSSASAVDNDDDDSLFCILSNILFISGGIVYITASSWDYSLYATAASPNDVDITTILTHFTYLLYETIWILGPFVYFLNSIVDIKWALRSKRRYRKLRDAQKLVVAINPSSSSLAEDNKETNIVKEIIRQLRNNVGTRRTLGAASTFGLGAFCGLVGALLSTRAANVISTTTTTLDNNNVSDTLYAQADAAASASVHIYLLSAICVLWKTTKAWKVAVKALFNWNDSNSSNSNTKWYNNPSSLFTLGDILFGIAAINDTISTDSTLDDGYMYSMPIFSAILWTLDALLYTRGDICVFRLEAAAAAGAAGGGVVDLSSPAPPVVVAVDPENEIV